MTIPSLANVLAERRRLTDEDSPAAWLRRARDWWPQVFQFLDDLCGQAGRIYGGKVTYEEEIAERDHRMWPEDHRVRIALSRGKTQGGTLQLVFRETGIDVRCSDPTRTHLRRGGTPESDPTWFTRLTETFASACGPFGA